MRVSPVKKTVKNDFRSEEFYLHISKLLTCKNELVTYNEWDF